MTFKRRNGCRNKHGRGHVNFIRCSNCGKCCPKVMDMKESVVPLSSPAPPAPRRSVTKSQGKQVNLAQASALAAEPPLSSSNAIENGNNQEGEADGYSIYIKGLPLNATLALLENEFKRFGPTKTVSS